MFRFFLFRKDLHFVVELFSVSAPRSDVEVSFIGRCRLRPYMGAILGVYLKLYLCDLMFSLQ